MWSGKKSGNQDFLFDADMFQQSPTIFMLRFHVNHSIRLEHLLKTLIQTAVGVCQIFSDLMCHLLIRHRHRF